MIIFSSPDHLSQLVGRRLLQPLNFDLVPNLFENAWDEVTRNSRGHVFNLQTGECVAWPFPKFFNLGENQESLPEKFPWDQPYEIMEKLWPAIHEKFSVEEIWGWCREALLECARRDIALRGSV